jgi:hypothetical protein
VNGLKYFPVPVVQNEESVIVLRSGEEAMIFQIDSEVVEPPFDVRRQLKSLLQRHWRFLSMRRTYGEKN